MSVILAADVGGTNCRLALFECQAGNLALKASKWIKTCDVEHTEALLLAFEKHFALSPHAADAVVVAIGGPVRDCEAGRLSNGSLIVDFAPLNQKGRRFFLINDFMAQAYAVVSPAGGRARLVAGPGQAGSDNVRAVLGAGTGLGQALLLRLEGFGRDDSQWLAVPSENGHAAFPFVNDAEQALQAFICARLNIPYVTGDIAIAGRGLALLHEFLTGEKLTAPEVGATALHRETETLRWYARLYGRACRHWIMATLCAGGLWIAGGIAAQNPLIVASDAFLTELYNLPGWENLLQATPVRLLENTDSGLWGAAWFGRQHLEKMRASLD